MHTGVEGCGNSPEGGQSASTQQSQTVERERGEMSEIERKSERVALQA